MNTRGESIVSGVDRTGASAGEPDGAGPDGAGPDGAGPDGREPDAGALAVALRGLAAGRIVLGAAALVAPNAMARASGVRPTPELGYMTRIFGARAIALGLGYLTASGRDRSRWQRLALLVDVLDTAHGAARLARGGLPRPTALGYTSLTGAYMAVGAARLARDLS
ncbi:hypothetical protein [Actinomadura violacea]|uniref:Uncharacterized protein n=1 Tax=Actinomadura violacea TaxID=2819934 RepID=A0ABS3S379_9ACTN|nr:hypothetical protein [Actinomadura violacea]MBO2463440.1 hypothetical protein [Actinomadura violacea]